MPWSPTRTAAEPPSGEYTVFHERPVPRKAWRTAKTAAKALAVMSGIAPPAALLMLTGAVPDYRFSAMAAASGLLVAGCVYIASLAILLGGISLYVRLFRPKQYVVDWISAEDQRDGVGSEKRSHRSAFGHAAADSERAAGAAGGGSRSSGEAPR